MSPARCSQRHLLPSVGWVQNILHRLQQSTSCGSDPVASACCLAGLCTLAQFQDPGEDAPASFRALDVKPAGSELLLGTHCCDLWVMNVAVRCTTIATGSSEGLDQQGAGVLPEPLIQGHTGDVYGLAYHPKKPHRFVTACQSHHLYVWHGKRRQLMVRTFTFAAKGGATQSLMIGRQKTMCGALLGLGIETTALDFLLITFGQ